LPEGVDATTLTSLINEVIFQTKELARGLHPVDGEPTGLMTALSRWADHITSVFDLSCCFECFEPVRVTDNALATQLYRIAQEAGHNAVKHGCATHLTIRLTSEGGFLKLTIHDNGAGFSREGGAAGGMGLQIMRHRAEAIGATLDIQSSPGQGTHVICSVPTVRETQFQGSQHRYEA
jgi:signal transduction histidine kinase